MQLRRNMQMMVQMEEHAEVEVMVKMKVETEVKMEAEVQMESHQEPFLLFLPLLLSHILRHKNRGTNIGKASCMQTLSRTL